MTKKLGTLAIYDPTFQIDDGFRLTIEPTFDALVGDIKYWHDFTVAHGEATLIGNFILGICMIRLKAMVPAARRGNSGSAYNGDGFDAAKRKIFGEHRERSLRAAAQFTREIYEEAERHGSKTATVAVLGTSPTTFQMPTTKEDLAELLRAIGLLMNGKTFVEFLRSAGRVRAAFPPDGGTDADGKRADRDKRSFALIAEDELKKKLAVEWGDHAAPGLAKANLLWWLAPVEHLNVKPYTFLPERDLADFAALLKDLYEEINDHRAKRGDLKRLK